MLSRLVIRPSGLIRTNHVTLNLNRSAYIHFKRKWDVNSYDENKELRKLWKNITDKEAVMSTISKRCEEPEKADWPKTNLITRRVGVIAKKLGYMSYWTRNGRSFPMCVLQVLDNAVMDTTLIGPDHVTGMYIAAGSMTAADIAKTPDYKLEPFHARSMHPRNHIQFMRTTVDALLPEKYVLDASHFRVGQFCDIMGKSIDRGFQGGMKRHGFKGLPASHGVSKAHRAIGAIGNRKDGVWKGTKMPGHMGGHRHYARCCRVVRIDYRNNLIFVHGRHVIGGETDILSIHDAWYYPPGDAVPLPTHFSARDGELPAECFWDEMIAPGSDTVTFKAF